jgi:ribosome maturation protein SDO1
MTKDTIARITIKNKHFEIIVDLEKSLKLRKREKINIQEALLVDSIFYNSKEGSKASSSDLKEAFGTEDFYAVAEHIITKGDIQLPKDYRDEKAEERKKKVIEFFVKNAVDARTNRPFTADMISRTLDQIGINITPGPIEQQVKDIAEKLKSVLPLKLETKKIEITVPASYTGKSYGIFNEYKEKEDWLPDGSLKVIINIPVGLQMEFYDKLNAITHGSSISQEVKQ